MVMDRWRGRTALITGAASGIGRAIAVELLGHGVNVVAVDRDLAGAESIRGEVGQDDAGQLMAVRCDVRKEAEILAVFDRIRASELGGVDICINSAGFGVMDKLSEGKTQHWRDMLEVNVLGLSICTREALRSMRERGVDDGHIVQMASELAHEYLPGLGFYSATKHAVLALTEGLRQELLAEKSGIRVTAISPANTRTNFMATAFGSVETGEKYYEREKHLVPADVVSAIVYALSAPPHVQVHEVLARSIGLGSAASA